MHLQEQLHAAGLDVFSAPVIPMSAVTGVGAELIRPEVEAVYRRWNKKVPAKELNAWLQSFSRSTPPPKGLMLLRIVQEKTRPPTFKVSFAAKAGAKAKKMPGSFTRCLAKALHESFDFGGVPVRLMFSLGRGGRGR